MYDVASIAPYVDGAKLKLKPPKLAMSIGGENRAGHVSANDLAKLIEQCGLERFGITAEGCRDLLALYAKEKTGSADAARELRGAHGGADRAAMHKVAERTGELSPVPLATN